MKKLTALTLVVLLAGCGGAPAATPTPSAAESRIVTAAKACPGARNAHGDGGKSMTLDTKGEDDRDGDTMAVVACYLRELETPDYVIQHIDSTRSLDGQQTEEWDGIKARWTYHPNRGLIITLVDTEA